MPHLFIAAKAHAAYAQVFADRQNAGKQICNVATEGFGDAGAGALASALYGLALPSLEHLYYGGPLNAPAGDGMKALEDSCERARIELIPVTI